MRAEEAARRALAAVARLTVLAGAAGCAGNVVVDPGGAPEAPEPGEAVPNEPPDETVDIPQAQTGCLEEPADATACCHALLTESFADDELFSDPTAATDEEKACCDLAVTTADTWEGPGVPPFEYELVSNCCVTGLVEGAWEVHPSCTPWGPPMPPAMLRSFDLFALEVVA